MSLYVGNEKIAPIIRIFEEGGEPVNINNQSKTITPTKSEQTITYDDGYTGLSNVVVNPIPDDYIVPVGNLSITENGTTDVSKYDTATVNVQPALQEKSVTLSRDAQDITADETYYGLSKVSVPGIPEEYIVPSGSKSITSNGTTDVKAFSEVRVNVQPSLQDKTVTPSESAQQITADTSYYGLKTVTVASIPSKYVVPSGSVSITSNGTHSVSGKANAVVNVQPLLEDVTIYPTTELQEISVSEGYDGIGSITVGAVSSGIDDNIKAENIKTGVSILGVTGTYDTPHTSTTLTDLDFSSGSINITPSEGKLLDSVKLIQPDSLSPENIKSGATIMGITGTYTTPISTTDITADSVSFLNSNTYTVTRPDDSYINSVVFAKPSTLEAANIKSGTTIFGITGTYSGTFEGTELISDLQTHDVSGKRYAKVDATVNSSDIRKGVSILGVTGEYEGADYTTQYKTVATDFSAGNMSISPDTGYDYLTSVTVTKPSTLTAANIKSGITVAGIKGTYAGTYAGTATITDTSKVDVSGKQYAQVVDNNLIAGNIKEGVSILGVTGTASLSNYPKIYFNYKGPGLVSGRSDVLPDHTKGWVFDFLATTTENDSLKLYSSLQMDAYAEYSGGVSEASVEDDVITIKNENSYINYIELRVNTQKVRQSNTSFGLNGYYSVKRPGYITSIELVSAPVQLSIEPVMLDNSADLMSSESCDSTIGIGKSVDLYNFGSVYKLTNKSGKIPTGTYKFKISFINTTYNV